MKTLQNAFFYFAIGIIFIVTGFSRAAAEETKRTYEEQDFLFLNEEGYNQDQFEIQVNTGFEFFKNKQKEREFELEIEEDEVEIEEEREAKRLRRIAIPLELEVGIFDWWEMEVETAYEQVIERSVEINQTGNKSRQEHDHFQELEYANNFQIVREGTHTPAVKAGMGFVFPTGNVKEREIQTRRVGYEWNLAASKGFKLQRLPGRLVLHANTGFGITPHAQGRNKDQEPSKSHDLREFNYGVAAVWQLPEWWSFMLELRHELEEEIELNRRVSESEFVLLPGFSVRSEVADKLDWELGCGFPIGLTPDANDWGFILQLKLEA